MRENLQPLEGRRCVFRGVFKRCGHKLCDHIWLVRRRQLEALTLSEGDVVEFRATVKRYTKGYRGRRDIEDAAPISEDFKLARPSHFRVVSVCDAESDASPQPPGTPSFALQS